MKIQINSHKVELSLVKLVLSDCRYPDYAVRDLRNGQDIGEVAFRDCRDREQFATLGLPGWPQCRCTGCGCSEPATTTDDTGIEVCEECSQYTCDDEGQVHCSRMDDTEQVTESCGAGNQQRTYTRIKPPSMPAEVADGEWAVWWETVGDDARLVSRHGTRGQAEQAVRAHDWPRPGDHTQYQCGYGVRELVDGQWVPAQTEGC